MSEGQFEAIKYALRQSKDGVVVSFVVHPNDVSPELMALPIGSIVNIEWSEVKDEQNGAAGRISSVQGQMEPAGDTGLDSRPAKSKRRFDELPLSQQCAITCEDKRFWDYLRECHWIIQTADDAAEAVRTILGIDSRSELTANPDKAQNWRVLQSNYQSWLTEQRYPAEVRG